MAAVYYGCLFWCLRGVIKMGLLTVAVVALVGCDRVVSSTEGASRDIEKDVYCNKLSYCYTCMPGFSGKTTCTLKFSAFCPGEQSARVKLTEIILTHKSGRVTRIQREKTIEKLGVCR